MVRIYIAEIEEDRTYIYEEFLKILPKDKKERLLRYKFKKDFLLSLMGEVLLRYGLDDMFGYRGRVDIEYGTYKKPYLKRPNTFFNISHSGKYAACAIGNLEVGLDIQKKESKDIEKLLSLSKSFFCQKEIEDLSKQEDQRNYFYQLWTLKESYIKYKGVGLHQSLDSFSFQIKENRIEFMDFNDAQCQPQFKIIDYDDRDYVISICTEDLTLGCQLIKVDNNTIDKVLKI